MTVKELIERLKNLPPGSPILVQGYEDGFSEIDLKRSQVKLNQNSRTWEGPHAEVDSGGVPAVLILRRENDNALE